MSSNSYAPKVPMTDDEIKRWKPVCADFVSFRAGVRAAERAYNVGDLVRQANHYMDEWSNVCNQNQRLLNRIASLEAERDQLRAEVERLRGDSVPLGAIRALAVEAIRDVTGCPDIANGDKCITDTIEHIAQHATYRAIEAAKEAK